MKRFLIAAIIALLIATICVVVKRLLMKLMAFISLIIFDVYALVAIFKDRDKD